MPKFERVPVIDIFAGPGGLGEGFSSYQLNSGIRPFDIRLSIEKENWAHQTLLLRSFYRLLRDRSQLTNYRRRLRGELSTAELFELHPREAEQARAHAWQIELGSGAPSLTEVRERVDAALDGAEPSVLIGGPPCQAYSLAGRSRNKGISGYKFEDDHRTTLYVEYPAVLRRSPGVETSLRQERIFGTSENGLLVMILVALPVMKAVDISPVTFIAICFSLFCRTKRSITQPRRVPHRISAGSSQRRTRT